MLTELKKGTKVVGAKQTRRAVLDGRAVKVYYAPDADPALWEPLVELCGEHGVPTHEVGDMKQLGHACGIAVGAAIAALVSE